MDEEEFVAAHDLDLDAKLNETEAAGYVNALVLAKTSGACGEIEHEDHASDEHKDEHKLSKAQVWGSTIIAVAIISLFGLLMVVVFPLAQNPYTLSLLVSLSVGTMSGDALLHLIPHALDIHLGHENESHADEDEHAKPDGRWIMLMALIALVVFACVEKIIHALGGHNHGGLHAHGHGHGHAAEAPAKELSSVAASDAETASTASQSDATYEEEEENEAESSQQESSLPGSSDVKYHTHACIRSGAVFGWMNLVGDGWHNLIDGILIGVSFSASFKIGIATSVAILLHEIPQEVGDYGVLFAAGFSWPKAALFNTLSAMIALLGGFIGIGIGSSDDNLPYVLAFAAGGFLYISLTDMLPQLLHSRSIWRSLVELVGFSIGVLVMVIIATYGEDEDKHDH